MSMQDPATDIQTKNASWRRLGCRKRTLGGDESQVEDDEITDGREDGREDVTINV